MTALDALSAQQREALDEALEFVVGLFAPWGVVAAGTIVQGIGDPASDIDLFVLHDAPFRQRLQRTFREVPFEIFVNTESSVLAYFEKQASEGRPVTAHMLATGAVVLGESEPRLEALRAKARTHLETPPSWSAEVLTQARYGAATLVEDALDRRASDPETAMRILGNAMEKVVTFWFKGRGKNIPRSKEVLGEIDRLDPALGRLFRDFWGDGTVEARWSAALAIADEVLGTRGFFEWDSERLDATTSRSPHEEE